MPESELSRPSLHHQICQRTPHAWVTWLLIGGNGLAFVALLIAGAGLWHSSSGVQLAWGASFGPATKDGEWWRLGSAMFVHFGVLHLGMNMWALWDGGQLVERMYGHARFAALYFVSGLTGNLVSLIVQGDRAVSAGASGAVFGLYGALLVFLWRERRQLQPREFRWMFWGAAGFSVATIVLGFIVPGIDNAAHIAGFVSGVLIGVAFARPMDPAHALPVRNRLLAGGAYVLAATYLATHIPAPIYLWSEEALARQEINYFLHEDEVISSAWEDILKDGKRRGTSFTDLARRVDQAIAEPYEHSFEQLSNLHVNPRLPSAATVEALRRYAELRRNASRDLVEGLRANDPGQVRDALERAGRAGQQVQQDRNSGTPGDPR